MRGMARRRRARRVAKWTAAILCLANALLYVASVRWLCWCHFSPPAATGVWIGAGILLFDWDPYSELAEGQGFLFGRNIYRFRWWFTFRHHDAVRIEIPLWAPLLSLLLVTYLLWRHDVHPYAPGHCHRCGYDLTGNVSGACPECGAPVQPCAQGVPAPGKDG